jgi:hypothetical protein
MGLMVDRQAVGHAFLQAVTFSSVPFNIAAIFCDKC